MRAKKKKKGEGRDRDPDNKPHTVFTGFLSAESKSFFLAKNTFGHSAASFLKSATNLKILYSITGKFCIRNILTKFAEKYIRSQGVSV